MAAIELIAGHLEKVRALAAGPRILAIGGVRAGDSTSVTLLEHETGKRVQSIAVPGQVSGIAAFPDGSFVVVSSDGAIRILSAKGEIRHSFATTDGPHTACAVTKDRVASVGLDGFLRVRSIKDGKLLLEERLSSRPLRAVAIDPSGEAYAAAGDDGVVRAIGKGVETPDGKPAVREMPGHEGAVNALVLTPNDGRLISGGEDGSLRITYLVGDTAAEIRGKDDSGHAGGITALAFLPAKAVGSLGDRLASAGVDGNVRIWKLSERRKPRTFDFGRSPLYGLVVAPGAKPDSLGRVLVGGDSRTLHGFVLDGDGGPTDATLRYVHGFDVLATNLAAPGAPVREQAVRALALLAEPEAAELLVRALDRDKATRKLALEEIGRNERTLARKGVRAKLDDEDAEVRIEALRTLLLLEKGTPLAALRSALGSKFGDVRAAATLELGPLYASSPAVLGLVVAALSDPDREARRAAFTTLESCFPQGSMAPLATAFERGTADVRAEVIVKGALTAAREPRFAAILGKALDDADVEVRKLAFVVSALSRRRLVRWLTERDEAFVRDLAELEGRALGTGAGDDAKTKLRERLLGGGLPVGGADDPGGAPTADDDRAPLLSALACKAPDTSLRGARGLAVLGDLRALGALLVLSREGDSALRREAASALKLLADPRAARRLVWMLSDADADVRSAAYSALAGRPPAELAADALRSAHEDVRVRGLDLLVKLGKGSESATALLGEALEDESPKVRSEAFRTLFSWHPTELSPLTRALEGRFPDLRLRALSELERLATEASSPHSAVAKGLLSGAIADRDAGVAKWAYEATLKIEGKGDATTVLAAIASTHPSVRALGAKHARRAPSATLRSPLSKLLDDGDATVRTTAVESLDELFPDESGPIAVALQSSHLDLRVRAAELLAARHDEKMIDPMRALLADKELALRIPADVLVPLRQRAATALGTVGSARLLRYLGTELVKDDDPIVREQAARGLANGSKKGDEGYLLDLLGHGELAVRSWAAEGLARLGDVRALPVLTGTLRHGHGPIRVGAILSFAALGPEGYTGLLQGLEDPSRDVQRIVLSIVLSRDLAAFRRAEPPDLLTSALSSLRPEVRFIAARSLELRIQPDEYLAHLVEVLLPDPPEKGEAMDKWPSEEDRARLMVALADALAGGRPEQRYAASQALRLRGEPLLYFREVRRAARLASVTSPPLPETTPRAPTPQTKKGPLALLRRLFTPSGAARVEDANGDEASPVSASDQEKLRLVALGAYIGLLRQGATDDESHRVRRDAVERLVALVTAGHATLSSVTPTLSLALDDPHHLVRRAAFAALKVVYGPGSDEPLTLALASGEGDVVRAALDELVGRGEAARPRMVAALDSKVADARRYAFELLEKLSPKGSAEALFAALGSAHTDIRIGVLERLRASDDARVIPALEKALGSDHEDLRLRAAELLASRVDDRAADVLAEALRIDDASVVKRAREALVVLGTPAAVSVLSARIEAASPPERIAIAEALGRLHSDASLGALAELFSDDDPGVRRCAIDSALLRLGARQDTRVPFGQRKPKVRDPALTLPILARAAKAVDPELRLKAAQELDDVDAPAADGILVGLFSDRDSRVRRAAVTAYARRVEKKGAPEEPLEPILRQSARDTLLPAAEGLAARGFVATFRALLLVSRAGEAGERERALLALGTLGDERAIEELETIAGGGTEEAPAELSMQSAALEALGRMLGRVKDDAVAERVRDRIEGNVGTKVADMALAAVRALRYVPGERARSRLEGILRSSESAVAEREEAAKALGERKEAASEGALAEGLKDDFETVRVAAREALDELFPGERTRVELHAIESPDGEIAGGAARFLAAEGDPALLLPKLRTLKVDELRDGLRFGLARRAALPEALLATLLAAKEPEPRADAAWLVGVRGVKSAALEAALSSAMKGAEAAWRGATARRDRQAARAEAEAFRAAMFAARRLRLESSRKEIVRIAADAKVDMDVRIEAVIGVSAVLGDSAEQPLRGLLRDGSLAVRVLASSALAGIAGVDLQADAPSPFDPVVVALASRGGPTRLATHGGRLVTLPRALPSKRVEALVDVARDGTGRDRLDAMAALGRSGARDAIDALRSIATAKKEPEEVRKAAYRALRRAGRVAAKEARG